MRATRLQRTWIKLQDPPDHRGDDHACRTETDEHVSRGAVLTTGVTARVIHDERAGTPSAVVSPAASILERAMA